jgi:DNA-binding transcriptional ArsR family regulator
LLALSFKELCVCQITAVLDLAPSTVSKHLSILYGAELVNMRKSGKWVYYSLAGNDAPKSVRELIKWVIAFFMDSEEMRRDLKKLKKVTSVSPEDLCQG